MLKTGATKSVCKFVKETSFKENIVRYEEQLKPILKSVFDAADAKVQKVVAPYIGTYERLNQRSGYRSQFNENLRAKNESPKVTIHDPFLKKYIVT